MFLILIFYFINILFYRILQLITVALKSRISFKHTFILILLKKLINFIYGYKVLQHTSYQSVIIYFLKKEKSSSKSFKINSIRIVYKKKKNLMDIFGIFLRAE